MTQEVLSPPAFPWSINKTSYKLILRIDGRRKLSWVWLIMDNKKGSQIDSDLAL